MPVPIRLPELGTDGEPVRVSNWLVAPGDDVGIGHRVVEVLVRGATFDVAAPADGRLSRIESAIDAVVRTDDILGWIDGESS